MGREISDAEVLVVADPANIHNNVVGAHVVAHSTFNMLAGTITGNTRSGVGLESASEASFGSFDGSITISGNGINGVQINDLSFALFTNGGPLLNVTGNTALDVKCNPQFSATRGVFTDTNGAKTNCMEP